MPADMPRFAAVGCVGFLAWFRARARGIFLRESLSKVAAVLEHEKFRTEINTPRACENVPQFENVTLVQITAVPG
jgi:hypothetical protein